MDEKNAFLSKYDILRQLGAGGMAKVYLARDKRLDRLVALKTIHAPEGLIASDTEAEQIFQRVRREAQAIARLNHHNIVTIFDVYLPSDTSAQSIYLALEYIDGKTLDQAFAIKKDHAVGEDETLHIGAELANALAYAHSRGICHRDIKPANIMREADTGRMVLLDFSLAYNLSSSTHTLTSSPIGTPAYMSPEQILTPTQVDHRTDVYSLGLVLYFMMAGVPPFQGDSYFKLCDQQIGELPEPLRNKRPEISELVERAIFQAICKKPDERIQSAKQMADLLSGIQQLRDEHKRFGVEPSDEKIEELFAKATEKDVFVPPELEVPPTADDQDSIVKIVDAPPADATIGVNNMPTEVGEEKSAAAFPTIAAPQTAAPEPEPTILGSPAAAKDAVDATQLEAPAPRASVPPVMPGQAASPPAEPPIQKNNARAIKVSAFVVVLVLLLMVFGMGSIYYLFFGSSDEPGDQPGVTQQTPVPTATPAVIARATPTPEPTPDTTPAPTASPTPEPTISQTPRPTPTATPVPTRAGTPSIISLAFRQIPPRELDWKASRNFKVSFIGQSEAAAIGNYEYRLDGQPWKITTSAELEFENLPAGEHRLQIIASDTAGNRSLPLEHAFTVVNKEPTLTWSQAPAPESTVRVPPAQSLVVSATDPDGEIATYRFGINSDTPGLSSESPSLPLEDLSPGHHTIYAWAVDDAGQISQPIQISFTIERNAPPEVMVRIPDGEVEWDSRGAVPFAIRASDDSGELKNLEMRIGEGPWKKVSDGEMTLSFERPGKHIVAVRAQDADGLETIKEATITVQGNLSPVVSVALSESKPRSGEPLGFSVTASDPDGSSVQLAYRLNSGSWQNLSGNKGQLPDLQPGSHTLEVRATDDAGAQTSKKVSFEVESFLQVEKHAGLDLKLVKIAGGTFMMGKDGLRGASPAHEVTVPSFYLGQTEVTVRQWNIFLKESGYVRVNASRRTPHWDNTGYDPQPEYPAVHVTWEDAVAFCAWLSKETGKKYALPTEAMWEYAARAGTSTTWSFGDEDSELQEYAWYDRNSGKRVNEVAKKKPNPWGLYDIHGNVFEWVRDFYDPNYYSNSPKTNPLGPSSGREHVIRGGSFLFGSGYTTSFMRESYATARINVGFRVCLLP